MTCMLVFLIRLQRCRIQRRPLHSSRTPLQTRTTHTRQQQITPSPLTLPHNLRTILTPPRRPHNPTLCLQSYHRLLRSRRIIRIPPQHHRQRTLQIPRTQLQSGMLRTHHRKLRLYLRRLRLRRSLTGPNFRMRMTPHFPRPVRLGGAYRLRHVLRHMLHTHLLLPRPFPPEGNSRRPAIPSLPLLPSRQLMPVLCRMQRGITLCQIHRTITHQPLAPQSQDFRLPGHLVPRIHQLVGRGRI
jgi:hypothetical protein